MKELDNSGHLMQESCKDREGTSVESVHDLVEMDGEVLSNFTRNRLKQNRKAGFHFCEDYYPCGKQ